MIRSQWQITTAEWPTKVLSRANRIISMHLAGRGVRCYCSGTIKLAQPMRSLFRDLKGILCFILLPQNRIKKKPKKKTEHPVLNWAEVLVDTANIRCKGVFGRRSAGQKGVAAAGWPRGHGCAGAASEARNAFALNASAASPVNRGRGSLHANTEPSLRYDN